MKLESSLRDASGFLYTAPLLDMVLLLLVFFLLGSNFVLKSGVAVDVPTFDSTLPRAQNAHVITILPPGSSPQIYVNENLVRLDQLEDFLPGPSGEDEHVIIRADRTAAFGTVMSISDRMTQRGYRLAFATVNPRQD